MTMVGSMWGWDQGQYGTRNKVQSVQNQGSVWGWGQGSMKEVFCFPSPQGSGISPALPIDLKTIYPASGMSGPVFESLLFSPSTLVRPILCSTPYSYAGIPTIILYQSYDLSRGGSRWEVHSCIPSWPSETQQGWPALCHGCIPKPRRSSLWVTSGSSIIHPTAPTPLAQVI